MGAKFMGKIYGGKIMGAKLWGQNYGGKIMGEHPYYSFRKKTEPSDFVWNTAR
jgi:hypothetical protein